MSIKWRIGENVCAGALATAIFLSTASASGGGFFCGDGLIGPNENCDDGNNQSGDGCSEFCLIESNFECSAPTLPLADNLLEDGDFESLGDNTPWFQDTNQNETVICSAGLCTEGFGARQGAGWARLGSLIEPGASQLVQVVGIPRSHRYLDFEFMAPICDSQNDYIQIIIDQDVVFEVRGGDPLCNDPSYHRQLIDLETAPGGPYNDDGSHFIDIRSETFFETNGPSLFLLDNMRVAQQAGPPIPGRCEVEDLTLRYDDFDPGVQGDLASLGFSTFELADPVPWGTTDDGVCGTGQIPPGNFTGGAGDAACLDATVTGADIFSFLCTDAIDFSTVVDSQLSFLLNLQLGQKTGNDFFQVLVGTEPPDSDSIFGYEPFFTTFESVGELGAPPGEQIDINISGLDGEPEGYICFAFSSQFALYAQIDNIDVSFTDCIDDDDEDKLQGCFDNCSDVNNPDQTDSDGDGYGNACDADINRELITSRVPSGNGNDCIVNTVDLGILRAAFFSTPETENWNPDADFNNDQTVNVGDLGILRSAFFGRPGPSADTSVCQQPAP
ncbi:MAG: DUF4215 domain-containing protein [Gammaproteobacteria bacterium]